VDPDAADFVSALQLTADQYRNAYRKASDVLDGPFEAVVPHHLAEELIAQYGSLSAAADAMFDPGKVVIVDRYWQEWCRETQERVNARLGHRGYLTKIPSP
jgi:hypothetical protein